ncbi:family 43 glycosylhydrolase [Melittangium boletus]|uniref:family 43 glycosylhydrolase n=1 Tax=Melittangium boletus TaxID=83453 RepID=UPI003DA54A3C
MLCQSGCTQDKPLPAPEVPVEPVPTEPPPPVPPPALPPLEVTNPVIPGDFADPSVIKVGTEYWATATSSEWAPHYPLMRSPDLLHWEQVGSIFPEAPTWAEGNYWAPELAEDRGRYYVLYTARKKGGPLCVAVATATQVQGPYTDHGPLVCEDLGSIDGAMIRDENDRLVLVWKLDGNSRDLPTPLWAQEMTEDGAGYKLTGERTRILLNDVPWEGQLVEGAHLVRRNGWFYLFYAGSGCCGVNCNYGAGVARSRTLRGDWEKNPLNPIVKSNADFRCPGHGSIVTDTHGRDYLLYHAYRTTDSVYVGRQGVLDVITWGADGWPSINGRRGTGGKVLATPPPVVETFSSPALAPGWQWPNKSKPRFSLADGHLTLAPEATRTAHPLGGLLVRATPSGTYTAETRVDVMGLAAGALVGLSAVGDEENAVGLGLQGDQVVLWRRQGGRQETLASVAAPASADGTYLLRMTAKSGRLYRFALSTDGTSWLDVGPEQNGDVLPPWDRGIRVGLTVGGAAQASARFDSLRITPE